MKGEQIEPWGYSLPWDEIFKMKHKIKSTLKSQMLLFLPRFLQLNIFQNIVILEISI